MKEIVGESLAKRLIEWGVDTIFGLPGDGINGLMEGFRRRSDKLRFVLVHHEEAAAFMATGYAKATGKLGVCAATSGPGAIHLLNGLYDAKLDHVPVLALTGMQATNVLGTHYQQEVHLDRLYSDLAAYNLMITNPQQLPGVVDLAIRNALSKRTVAHLTFPNDIQVAPLSEDPYQHVGPGGAPASMPTLSLPQLPPSDAELARAADVLNAGSRVAMLVGIGARHARDEVIAVAEALGAPIVKTLSGKMVVPDDHPLTTGGLGLLGTRPSEEVMEDCDTLLMVGTSFPYSTHLPEPGKVRVVQIDADPSLVGMRLPTEAPVVADAGLALAGLLPKLARKTDRAFLERHQKGMATWREKMAALHDGSRDPIAPQYLMGVVDDLASNDAILTCDSGTIATWAARHWTIRGGREFYLSGNLATMAPGLPYAIGIQHAHPGRQVIAFVGDGGFAMLMAEFLTAVRHELPIKVVVNNNNSYGQILWEQFILGYPEYAVRHQQPAADFSTWARGCGAFGVKVTKPGDVESAIRDALAHPGPALVDCDVNPNEPPMPGKVEYEQAKSFAQAALRGQPHLGATAATIAKDEINKILRLMTRLLPNPVRRPPTPAESVAQVDVAALERDLAAAVDGEVRFDPGSRAAYSTDASNFRQTPLGVVVPRTVEAAVAAVAACRRHRAPIVSRGGGTSLAGECTNTAVVIDWSKYCHRLISVDPDARTCTVEPGAVLDLMNDQLRRYQLEFGPEPATHDHCTLGGMIGNNSCGATAQRTGKVVDNVVALEVLLYDGTRMWVGETDDADYREIQRAGGRRAEIYAQLRALRDEHLAALRTAYPHIPRRVSGYNLDSLLPEKGFHVAQALVGTEGTCVVVLRAKLRLVPRVQARTAVFLGYPDIASSADAVPSILRSEPIALEGLDAKLITFQQEKHLNPDALTKLPAGQAYLLVQMGGDTRDEADGAADEMLADLGKSRDDEDVAFFDDPALEKQMWLVRESGLGATARVPGLPDTWPGWEDSAVGVDDLGDYLRDLQKLYDEFGYGQASVYGHFGQGCVHSRIPFDLQTADGVAAYRRFVERAADLVASYGGSFSGEHGDGQQRGELLPKMFPKEIIEAFGRFKAIFDPDDRMNPGKVAPAYPLDSLLRLGVDYDHGGVETAFRYPEDEGSFGRAVLRCVGVGKCRRHEGGGMCPSYMVTKEEEHSTRGRSRLLFEMLDGASRGGAIADGWRSTDVLHALDLCLACKGCKADCPVNVDMATYKAEFLFHHFKKRLRPLAHYSMGWLPLWSALAAHAPRLVNALLAAPGLGKLAIRAAGIDEHRVAPAFARQSFQDWFASREPGGTGERGEVLLWPDTFSNHFHPSVAQAAVEVLEDAGWRVIAPSEQVCCGLTWISTGQLDTAKHVLRRTLDVLRPHLRAGTRVLGLEPSCTAVFRADATELFPDDADVEKLRRQTVTLAELLRDHAPGWAPPRLDRTVHVQTHCHHHAIMGYTADRQLLTDLGAQVDVLDSGCCGLAGNFGFEKGHYEVSEACAERVLLPAVRAADDADVILADGFSCRTQIEQGESGGRGAVHLAELLRAALHGDDGVTRPEQRWAPRPAPSSRGARLAAAAVGAAATSVLGGAVALLRGRIRR